LWIVPVSVLQHTTHEGHAGEVAAALDPSSVDGVVCVSGDGLVNEVLNVEREVVKDFKLLEQTLEEDLVSFSRGFTVFKDQVRG
jgi:hypothetical protein